MNLRRFGYVDFKRGASLALERSADLRQRAENFDQAETLKRLGENPINGFFYRFDDHLSEASFQTPAETGTPPNRQVAKVYKMIGKEERIALRFTASPGPGLGLEFEIETPNTPLTLDFGASVLLGDRPITFRIYAGDGRTTETLYEQTVTSPEHWTQTSLDVSQWRGRKVRFVFEAEGPVENVAFWSNPILRAPPQKPLNVIFIIEDSLRADHLSTYGYSRPTSPVKDAFAREGVAFEYAFSQATKTRPSCPTIMTSLYPTATGVWRSRAVLSPSYLTLAEIMRHQGFATTAFLQNPNAGGDAGLNQGFGTSLSHWGPNMGKPRTEKFYTDQVFPWLDSVGDRNFFLYLHIIDPHVAYDPPEQFRHWFEETKNLKNQTPVRRTHLYDPPGLAEPTLEGRNALYDGEIAANDFWFGKFLDRLKEKGLYENTLIVFTSDHGEYLGEKLMWEHHPPGYIHALHVPLIAVYPPLFPKAKRIGTPVQLIDIMPTILEIAGVDNDLLLEHGDSLVSLIAGDRPELWDFRLALSEEVVLRNIDDPSEWGSIFHRGWHHIDSDYLGGMLNQLIVQRRKKARWPFAYLKSQFLNYRNDPAEKNYWGLLHIDPFLKRSLNRFMHELQDNNLAVQESIRKGKEAPAPVDLEAIEALEDLGYFGP